MEIQTRPVGLLVVPDSIDGLLSVLQDVYVKAGHALIDIHGYRTFLDASYLGSAEEALDDIRSIAKFTQTGLIASQHGQEMSR